MTKRNLITSLVVVVLVVGVIAGYLIAGARPKLGLDLQGGISAIYSPVIQPGQEGKPADFDQVLDETISIIRSRVDSLGVAEPEISRQGDDVLVQLPGLQDPERARQVIGTTAKLTFRRVQQVINPGDPTYASTPACVAPEGQDPTTFERPTLTDEESGILCGSTDEADMVADPQSGDLKPVKYKVGPAEIKGEAVDNALAVIQQNGWVVQLDLNGKGAQTFATITSDLACARDKGERDLFAIVLDNRVESAPGVAPEVQCGQGIVGGSAQITVGGSGQQDSEQQAKDLALVLKTGALPISLKPQTFETVSPTLGTQSLRSGLFAGLLGLGLVALYLLFFYRWLGAVAIIALTIFGLVMVGLITALGQIGFTLTLAGVAGVVASIGITADSSIIYFERIRDEVNSGKTMRTSVKRAFSHAFRTNLTGNTTTLAAAIILYFLAVGPVRGFALTLGMSTVLDILILYFYTRAVVGLLGRTRVLSRHSVRASEPAPVAGGSK